MSVDSPEPSPAARAPGSSLRRWLGGFRKPWKARELLWLALCPLLLFASAAFAEAYTLGDSVLFGVRLNGLPVTGVSRDSMQRWFDAQDAALTRREVLFEVGKQRFILHGSDVGLQLDRTLLDELFAAGRSGNLLRRISWRAARVVSGQNFRARVDYHREAFAEIVARWERASLAIPHEASVRYLAGHLQRIDPTAGERVDLPAAQDAFREWLTRPQLLESQTDAQNGTALSLKVLQIAPKTSVETASRVESKARALLSGALRVRVEYPPPDVQAPPTRNEEETLTPRQLGPTLRCRQAEANPAELEVFLDEAALDHVLAGLRAKHEQKATNASFAVEAGAHFRVRPSRVQTRISTEQASSALWAAAESNERLATFQLVAAEQPKITTETALQLNIREQVAHYVTHYPCCQPRVKNIQRIAELIDGTIIAPGDTFSVNEFIGPRTEANGFVPAPTIVFGEMDDTVGGGVSQFATTLFNAVLEGGYEIIERQPHTYYFERYPIGNDATLSIPKPDLIFKNDTRSGLLIKAEGTKTSIIVRLYGDKEGRTVQRSVSQPFDRIEPAEELLADDLLDPTKQEISEKGAQGFTVETTRTLKLASGEVLRQSRKVIYRPRVRRVRVHSCRLPKGHSEFTGKPCPLPEVAPDNSETTVTTEQG